MSLLSINYIDFSLFLWYNPIINKNKKERNKKHGKRFIFGRARFFEKR